MFRTSLCTGGRGLFQYCISIIVGLLFMLVPLQVALADNPSAPPGLPHQFYGSILNNGSSIGPGYTVEARIGGGAAGSCLTDSQGRYGYYPQLYVTGQNGQTIEFYVGGLRATQTAICNPGTFTRLDLTVSGTLGSPGSPSTLTISTASLPNGTVGATYSQTVVASGGTGSYSFVLASGSSPLPGGLSINSSGAITGTPTTSGTFTFTAQVTDSASPAATFSKPLSITVAAAGSSGNSISASMLGNSVTFSLSGGVLSTATDLASADSRVKLSFAANTSFNLQGQTSLAANNESNAPAGSDNSTLIRAYSFTPAGAVFSPAATMTLKYDSASLPAGAVESSLYIAYWTGSAWQSLTSTVNTTNREVSAPVSHFTVFALRSPAPGSSSNTNTNTNTNTTTTAGTVTTNVLGSSGSFSVSSGTASSAANLGSADGKVNISLASGTAVNLQGSQQLTVIQLASPPSPPANTTLVAAYSFEPNNATFNPALTVTIKYSLSDIPSGVSESGLYIALLEGSSWTPLPSTVNTQNKTVAAQVSHFSTYGLLGALTETGTTPTVTPPATSSPLITSDLTIMPEVAGAGQQVTISVRVINGSASEATKTVVLKINDKDESQKTVTLAASKSQVVSFTVSKADAGSYKAAIDSLNASFEVKAGAGGGQPGGLSWPIMAIIGVGGLAVIVLVIVLIARQRQ